ncbi:dynamin family protein [Tumebacillus flagellatus]|uniref:Dynamin N-terminal domain-containing protein n=1 Tax=Tumebacillus flagellatus TaxID=1157490 RepID=A0A074MEC9_9BACL|nr:dynamin family protein [Tumebacillus flagellatus]KEO84147.1 hypothetical protein EL26_06690 [Tumebacillus flagellatus]
MIATTHPMLDEKFITLADTYIPLITEQGQSSYRDLFAAKLEKLNTSEFLVPVLGLQGTGKSSLLNALLMKDLVLPVDADETTCIPVEVRYGKRDGEVHVFFRDQDQAVILENPKELELYVHNLYNPGNEKQVTHVVVYSSDELLANQLVLVDLPGVGSLTPRNVESTMSYIERLSAAIFMLRTVPTITKSERAFLASAWPKLTTAWFVQNQWNDETPDEVEDSRAYNLQTLQQIADQYKTGGAVEIRVLNVYQALQARLQHDPKLYEQSGVHEIRELLRDLSLNWQKVLQEEAHQSLLHLIQDLKQTIATRLADFSLSREERLAKYQEQERHHEEKYRYNRNLISEIEEKISAYRTEYEVLAREESKRQTENLRNEMRRIIQGGVVDGHLLNRAYQEQQEYIISDLMEDLSLGVYRMQQDLSAMLGQLQIQDFQGEFTKDGTFHREEAFKFEKAIPHAMNLGSAIGAVFLASAVGGPVGIVVGLVAGLGMGLLGGFLGRKAKSAVNQQRQKYTLRDLEGPLSEFESEVKRIIQSFADHAFVQIEQGLESFVRTQYEILQAEKQQHDEAMFRNEQFDQQMREKLQQDLEWMTQFEVSVLAYSN